MSRRARVWSVKPARRAGLVIAAAGAVCAALGLAPAGAPLAERAGRPLFSLHVTVTGVRSASGHVRIGLYTSAEGWPVVGREAVGRFVPARRGSVSHLFSGLSPGRYAVAVFHDENDNGVLDTNIFGAPREGVGFSRNARARFAPPAHDDALFEIADHDARIAVRMRY